VRLFKLPSPDVFWFLSWPPCGQAQVHRQKIKNTWFSTFSYVLLCVFVSRPLPFWDFDHRSLICFMDFSWFFLNMPRKITSSQCFALLYM
jgi:hypothetical protein